LSQPEKVSYLLSLKEQETSVVAISEQYDVPRSTFYHWLSRHNTYHTYEDRSTAPHTTHCKITEEVRAAVLEKHHKNPRLGSWRLSLFDYAGQNLKHTSIGFILMKARHVRLPPKYLYNLTHPYQIWFIDHMHLRTLPNGQKVYSLIILDGFTRFMLTDEICLSKTARDACLILLRAFARWGLPEEIVSDNAKSFTSLLYRLLMGVLRVKVNYITPGHPWENPFAESFIGVLRAYFYPHIQRQKTVAGIQRVYTNKTDYYNHRVHWEFRKDEVKTPFGKLGSIRGRPMPEEFELKFLATGKRFKRTVDGQGMISWKRYRLYVKVELKKEKIEIREFFDSLVVVYHSGTVVSYECIHERSEVSSIFNTPVFHDHPGIESSKQLELFDLSQFQLGYVSRRPPNHKNPVGSATQLVIEGLG
jgi:transposase InsO family protein